MSNLNDYLGYGSKEEAKQALGSRLSERNAIDLLHIELEPFAEMMSYYRCAIMEVETKFRVLNERFSQVSDYNPIETIKTRLKTPISLLEKVQRRGIELNRQAIEENIFDIAGVRVICSFRDDIYLLEKCFLQQDDVYLIQRKDYIESPKESGYRSLHLVVETPIFLETGKRLVKVEVQLRTIAMDFWASLEHKLRYKKDLQNIDDISNQLVECADLAEMLDRRMQRIQNQLTERVHENSREES